MGHAQVRNGQRGDAGRREAGEKTAGTRDLFCLMASNLQRLMAVSGDSILTLAQRSGVDERTIRSLLAGHKPHARTLHRLAEGLGVSVDEFFVDPAQLLYRCFDRATNPLVGEVVESRPELFEHWTTADFDELHSRFGNGGPLTHDGVLRSVNLMNRKREILDKLDLLLETHEGQVLGGIIDLFYAKIEAGRKEE